MWGLILAAGIWASPPEAPYVACIDGHIAKNLSECPPVKQHNNSQSRGSGGAPIGGGGGGLLGGLLGGLGIL